MDILYNDFICYIATTFPKVSSTNAVPRMLCFIFYIPFACFWICSLSYIEPIYLQISRTAQILTYWYNLSRFLFHYFGKQFGAIPSFLLLSFQWSLVSQYFVIHIRWYSLSYVLCDDFLSCSILFTYNPIMLDIDWIITPFSQVLLGYSIFIWYIL